MNNIDDDSTSPLVQTSRARRALEAIKAKFDGDLSLQHQVVIEEYRREYIRCIHNSAPTVMFQNIASFLNVNDRFSYALCSKYFYNDVVFGADSCALVWRYSSSVDLYRECSGQGRHKVVEHLINGGSIDVNWTHTNDAFGYSPLMIAAQKGLRDVVISLVNANANIEQKSRNGWTPLMEAAEHGRTAVVQVLIDLKAAVDVVDNRCRTALMWSCRDGHTATVKALIAAKANVDLQSQWGSTALMWASKRGRRSTVRALLDANAEAGFLDNNGTTALSQAMEQGFDEVARDIRLSIRKRRKQNS